MIAAPVDAVGLQNSGAQLKVFGDQTLGAIVDQLTVRDGLDLHFFQLQRVNVSAQSTKWKFDACDSSHHNAVAGCVQSSFTRVLE